ncbi:hypothetical protein ACFO4E_04325 [Nocardiopsis mangrovi]|uniref:ABC transporter permease n=1 Tax=Nocardiopsis mangrovi TaxID=1179818 RepID=A0ABV9DRR6_9ACTN
MSPRALAALALADVRDRVRRPAFLFILLAAAALGYLAAPPASAGYTMMKFGAFRGVYDSGYIGVMFALVSALWLSLCGFYAVKNAIGRDAATGVGEILAATPMRTSGYLFGKFLSNFLVLAAMAGIMALMGLGMQLLRGESAEIDPVALVLPFLLLCLPVLAISGAAALLFESVPLLRGGVGNIVWFFTFLTGYVASGLSGFDEIGADMSADLLAQHPDAGSTEFSLGITGEDGGLGVFHWSGLEVAPGLLTTPIVHLLAAVLLALLPVLWFGRFDPARGPSPAARRTIAFPRGPFPGGGSPGDGYPGGILPGGAATGGAPADGLSGTAADGPAHFDPPSGTAAFAGSGPPSAGVVRGGAFGRLLAGELRLLLKGRSPWWWLGLAGLTAVALFVPVGGGLGVVLLLAWIWPVLIWSRLGTQAREHRVDTLLDAGPARGRRPVAEWAAGVAVAAITGAGPLARMAVEADAAGVAAWAAGAAFIPALALLLGSATRGARLFQLVYLALWYAILNSVAAADVMGAVRDTALRPAGPHPLAVLAAAAVLLGAALLVDRLRHARR